MQNLHCLLGLVVFLFGFSLKIENLPYCRPTINTKFRPVFEIGIQLVLGDITHLGTVMKTSNSAPQKNAKNYRDKENVS